MAISAMRARLCCVHMQSMNQTARPPATPSADFPNSLSARHFKILNNGLQMDYTLAILHLTVFSMLGFGFGALKFIEMSPPGTASKLWTQRIYRVLKDASMHLIIGS